MALLGLQVAEHDHQQVVEIVGDAPAQLADRFQFLRRRKLVLRLPELLLRGQPLADVARDLGEADEGACVVIDRIDDDGGPELGAVFAHPQSFGFETTDGCGLVQRLLRNAGPAILLGVEAAEMLPNDLIAAIALDPFGAGIPGRYVSAGVELENGVVHHRLDEAAVAALA